MLKTLKPVVCMTLAWIAAGIHTSLWERGEFGRDFLADLMLLIAVLFAYHVGRTDARKEKP